MATDLSTTSRLDLRGRTITTYIAFELHEALAPLDEGARVEVVTDALPAIDTDLHAWCRTTGHRIVDTVTQPDELVFTIEKGPPQRSGRAYAAVVSQDGLLELLSPLAFALAAALEGHAVSLYFQGPAVRVLRRGHTPRLRGLARPFSRFPRAGLAAVGHVAPQEKIEQLRRLGARIYACGPSMEHFGVGEDDLAFDDVIIAEYLTFMEQLDVADIHVYA